MTTKNLILVKLLISYPLNINSLGFLDLFTQSNDTFEFLLLHLGWLVNPAVQEVVVLQFTGPHLHITGRRFDVHRCRWFLRGGKSHFLSAIKHQIFSKNEFDVQDMYKWYEFICLKIFLIRIKILTNPKTRCLWVPMLNYLRYCMGNKRACMSRAMIIPVS